MSNLREQVANFQVFPKYGIQIGEDNADLLIGMILEDYEAEQGKRIAELELQLAKANRPYDYRDHDYRTV